MIPHYANPEHCALLLAAAASWQQPPTPFRLHASVKGAGVDCIQLAMAIYRESRLPLEIIMPKYTIEDWRFRKGDGPAKRWLDSSAQFARVWEDGCGRQVLPVTGDALLLRVENSDHHIGIALSGAEFVHALRNYGVCVSSVNDATYLDNLAGLYRPLTV